MAERRHPAAIAKRLAAQLPDFVEALELLPVALRQTLRQHVAPPPRVVVTRDSLDRGQGARLIAGSVVLLGGVIWLAFQREPEWLGWVLSAVGALLVASQWRRRIR
jgi:hypothetical protein